MRGTRERKSAIKAAAVRKNAQKPRPKRSMTAVAATQVAKNPDVRAQVQETINRLRTAFWPTCEELVRQVLQDDLRDGGGRPLREPLYAGGGVLLDKQGRPRTVRVHVTAAQRLSVAQDLWDRTGFTRQVTTRLEAGDGLPELLFTLKGFSKPNAADAVAAPAQANGKANGHDVTHEGNEIPPPMVH